MEELKAFLHRMVQAEPEEWKSIPDIDLYMDQVIAYMVRQHIGLEQGEESLTSAMINNYIKNELLPRAKGKRYSREHIGYLTAICLLKQVLSVNETGLLLQKEMENQSVEQFYDHYRSTVGEVFCETAEKIHPEEGEEALLAKALELAISSYADRIACKRILSALEGEEQKG